MSPCLSPRYYISYYRYKIILILILLLLKQLGYEPAAGLTVHPPPPPHTHKKTIEEAIKGGFIFAWVSSATKICVTDDDVNS